jgi:arabinosaccharide transport system permease protein
MKSISASRRAAVPLKHLFFAALCALFLFPVYALLLAAFRPGKDLMRYGITLATLAPSNLSPANILGLFTIKGGVYFLWLRNSAILLTLQTLLCLFLSSWVGYGLGAYRFKGRNLVNTCVVFLMMVPIQILILPLYKLTIAFGVMNTYAGVLLPFVVSPFAIFFFRQYVSGIPVDFIDAGRIDGLSEYAIFFRIVAPLMAPAYGAMAIFTAMQSWNNFLWPLIVIRTGNMFTLPIGLNSLLTPYGNNYDLLIAGAAAATVPIIAGFVFFQRYFIAGLTSGGVKG